MLMENVEEVALAFVERKLLAVELIESASLRLQKQAQHQTHHNSVQLLVVVYRSLPAFLKVKIFS